MADLFNQQISATYSGLLKTTSNGILSSSLAQITDGRGNGSQLYLSTSKINFYNAYEFPTSDGSANQVLKTDGSGVLTWEDDANTGGVTKTGTIAINTIAVWNDNADQLRSDTTMSINTNHTISLLQPNSVPTDVSSYNIGGGNIPNVTGQNNTGFGQANMQRVTTGNSNTAFGAVVLDQLTIGSNNVGLGKGSLFSCTEGDANTGVGAGSLADVTTGDNNTALGEGTGVDITTTSGNTFIGKDSGRQGTGSNNTYVGFNSGSSLVGGDNNVIIGSNTGSTISTTSNNIIISDGSGNNRIQVNSGGNVGIGNSPSNDWADSRAIELGANGILWTEQASGQYNSLSMGLNFYVNSSGATLYKSANVTATRYQQYQGSHTFQTAGTGTPNSSATFVNQLTISSGGEATFQSASAKSLTGSFNVSINDSTSFAQGVGGGITLGGYKGATAQEFFAAIDGYKENGTSGNAAGAFRILTQPSDGSGLIERLRISSGGGVIISGSNNTAASLNLTNTSSSSTWTINTQYDNGDLRFLNGSVNAMRISTGGNVLIGTTDTAIQGKTTIEYGSNTTTNPTLLLRNGGGSAAFATFSTGTGATTLFGYIQRSGSGINYASNSDYRLKENVTPITDALSRVNQLKPSRFNFIGYADNEVDGFLAHEVQDIIPEAICGEKDAMMDEEFELTPRVDKVLDEEGNVVTEAVEAVMETRSVPDYQGIDQSKIVPLLTAAIQEQQTIIEDLKARIETLEG